MWRRRNRGHWSILAALTLLMLGGGCNDAPSDGDGAADAGTRDLRGDAPATMGDGRRVDAPPGAGDGSTDGAAPAELGADGPLPDSTPADAFVAPAVTIERWPHGAKAALSLSFDDATYDHFDVGLPLWKAFGFRVTLGILCQNPMAVPGLWQEIQRAFDGGHELANHSLNHAYMPELSVEQIRYQLDECTRQMKVNVTGLERVVTYVHPFSASDLKVESVVSKRFIVARGGVPGDGHVPVAEPVGRQWFNVLAFAPLSDVPLATWNDAVTQAVAAGGWLIEECHGIDGAAAREVGWEPRTEADLAAHYQHVQSFGAQIWVAPMGEVARYVQSRRLARLTVFPAAQDVVHIALCDGLDRAIYDVPLTLTTTVPAGWGGVSAEQGYKTLPLTPLPDGRLRFEARPDGPPIALRPASP